MQELVLNIYKMERDENGNRIVDKTYRANSCELMYGVIEDIVDVLELDKIDSDETMIKLIITALRQVKPILKDVFVGLTDEELKRTLTNEVIDCVLSIVSYLVGEETLNNAIKNLQGEKAK